MVTQKTSYTDISEAQWQEELGRRVLLADGVDTALYARAVRLFTAPGGIMEDSITSLQLPPRLIVHKGNTLPAGQSEISKDGEALHIVFDGDDDVVGKRMMVAYERWVDGEIKRYENNPEEETSRTAEGVSIKVKKSDLLRQPIEKDGPTSINRPKCRSRDDYDPTVPLNRNLARLNTWGQIMDWQEIKQSEPMLWHFYLERMFSDEILQKFSGTADIKKLVRIYGKDGKVDHLEEQEIKNWPLWKDWLRGLRVMNGLSTVDMVLYAGLKSNNGFSTMETILNHGMTLEVATRLLKHNVFSLPTEEMDGEQMVDIRYAEKFLHMTGHTRALYSQSLKRQFFKEVKAIAQAYQEGEIEAKDLPTLNTLLPIMRAEFGKLLNIKHPPQIMQKLAEKKYFLLDGIDYAPYFLLLPSNGDSLVAPPLSRDCALKKAGQESHLGKFLRTYHEAIGYTLEDLKKRMGISIERIRQHEANDRHSPEFLAKILDDSNPYDFPVDEERHIRKNVVDKINSLWKPISSSAERGEALSKALIIKHAIEKGGWLNFSEVSEVILGAEIPANGQRRELEDRWTETIEHNAPRMKPLRAGEIKINGEIIHCTRGKEDKQRRIRADEIDKVRTILGHGRG